MRLTFRPLLPGFVTDASAHPRRALGRRLLRASRGLADDDRGVVAIEFAIVLPVLLVLTFIILQYGFVLVTYHNMYDAARQAARQLAAGTADEAEAVAAAEALLVDWPTNWNVVAAKDLTNDNVNVRITVPGTEAALFSFTPMPTQLVAEVVMRDESWP